MLLYHPTAWALGVDVSSTSLLVIVLVDGSPCGWLWRLYLLVQPYRHRRILLHIWLLVELLLALVLVSPQGVLFRWEKSLLAIGQSFPSRYSANQDGLVGIDSSTVPTYQSELCRAEKRGRLVSWEVLFIGLGIVLAYWLDFGMGYAQGSVSWRFPIAFQLVFAFGVIALVFGLPESPRWLFSRGRDREAIEVLCEVFDLPESDEYIQGEVRAIKHALAEESQVKSHRALFRKDKLHTRRRVLLAYFALFMNQM